MQLALKNLLPKNRSSFCLTSTSTVSGSVPILEKLSSSNKFYRTFQGLNFCNNGWICPHCAPRLSLERSHDIESAVRFWRGDRYGENPNDPKYFSKSGNELCLALFTIPHRKDQSLGDLVDRIKTAYSHLVRSRAYRKFIKSFDIFGTISILEVTYNQTSGWHPHFHVLYFLERFLDNISFKKNLFALWYKSTLLNGFNDLNEVGFGVQNADFASDYISKYGRSPRGKWRVNDELARWHLKHSNESFTPFDLLEAHLFKMAMDLSLLDDDFLKFRAQGFFEDAGKLFIEFAEVFKGRHQCQWSRGLKEILTVPFDDVEDRSLDDVFASIASEIEEVGGFDGGEEQQPDLPSYKVLARLTQAQWKQVLQKDARCFILDNFQEFTHGRL